MKRKRGFTLSETLITLGVIGIIAAVTIPSITSSTNKATYVDGLKKAYLILKTATNELMLENGGTMRNVIPADGAEILNKYCTKLNCIKKCISNDSVTSGCWASDVKALHGTASTTPGYNARYGAVLSNGMTITVGWYHNACTDTSYVDSSGANVGCDYISIDINGLKAPNTKGRDIFEFIVYDKGLVAAGVKGTLEESLWSCNNPGAGTYNGEACAGKVLIEGAMNY